MKIKASGRSALILATGLFVCFAGPSQAAAASSDSAVATSKSESAAAGKSVKKRYVHRKSSKVASKSNETKSSETRKAADIADADSDTPIPASVANANAQLTPANAPASSAKAMSTKANTMLLAAADKRVEAQPTADDQVVSSDQLNDVDRALQQPPTMQTVAMASAKAAPAAPVFASGSDSSTWDQTSLIGKVFIAFGALLTMASAARMFMA